MMWPEFRIELVVDLMTQPRRRPQLIQLLSSPNLWLAGELLKERGPSLPVDSIYGQRMFIRHAAIELIATPALNVKIERVESRRRVG